MKRWLAVLCVCLLLPLLAEAGIYKWVDENGTIHFSDQPAPEKYRQKTREVEGASAVSASGKGVPYTQADFDKARAEIRQRITFLEEDCPRTLSGPKAFNEKACGFQARQWQTQLQLLESAPGQYFAQVPGRDARLLAEYQQFQKNTPLASESAVAAKVAELEQQIRDAESPSCLTQKDRFTPHKSDAEIATWCADVAARHRSALENFLADPDAYFKREDRILNGRR